MRLARSAIHPVYTHTYKTDINPKRERKKKTLQHARAYNEDVSQPIFCGIFGEKTDDWETEYIYISLLRLVIRIYDLYIIVIYI